MTGPTGSLKISSGTAAQRDPQSATIVGANDVPVAAMFLGLLDSSDDCIKLIDAEGRLELMNCNGRAAMEIDDMAMVAGQLWDSLWPAVSQSLVREALAQARIGKRTRFDAFCPTAKGTPKWWEVTVAPVPDQLGRVDWVLSTSRDITERVNTREQLEVLALEMRHRLRNAFSVSAGIISAMARVAPAHVDFAREVSTRLSQLAAVHSGLLDLGGQIEVEDLLGRVLLIDASSGIITLANIPKATIGDGTAKALALAIGELATNSIKYGAIGNGGQIVIDGRIEGDVLILDWTERDGNSADAHPAVSSGQGSQLVKRMLASIGGSIESEERPRGFFARLTLPLPGDQATPHTLS